MVIFKVLPPSKKKKIAILYTFAHTIGKGKAIPVQALTSPEGSRRLRRSDF